MSSDQTSSNSSSSPPEFELLDLEAIALRGIGAREALLKSEIEKITLEIMHDRAVVYGSIEARLGLPAGSIISGVCQIVDSRITVIPTLTSDEKGFAPAEEKEGFHGGDNLQPQDAAQGANPSTVEEP